LAGEFISCWDIWRTSFCFTAEEWKPTADPVAYISGWGAKCRCFSAH
jgi:hypothetical protein